MSICDKLIGELVSCNEIQKIHSLALDISDAECEMGLSEIMNKIKDKSTINHRGTLFYACAVYDCTDYFLILISNIVLGPYESAIEAYSLIVENIDYNRIRQQDLIEVIEKLNVSNEKLNHFEIIEETMNFLKDKIIDDFGVVAKNI